MYANPNENHTACILGEQFRRKGYNCEEVRQKDATILIVTHEKKISYGLQHRTQRDPYHKFFVRSN
jgi:hypothetical protein